METAFEMVILLLILLNFRLWGSSRIAACVDMLALQALAINLLPLLAPQSPTGWVLAVVGGATVIKVCVLPWLIRRALARTGRALIGVEGFSHVEAHWRRGSGRK